MPAWTLKAHMHVSHAKERREVCEPRNFKTALYSQSTSWTVIFFSQLSFIHGFIPVMVNGKGRSVCRVLHSIIVNRNSVVHFSGKVQHPVSELKQQQHPRSAFIKPEE